MHRHAIYIIMVSTCALTFMACDNEVEGHKAQVVEPLASALETPPAREQGGSVAPSFVSRRDASRVLAADITHSRIQFVGAKVTGKHEGGFKDFDGKLELGADGNLEMVVFTVKTDSIYSDEELLTGHLKTPDFLDTARNPEARFESTSITVGSKVKTDDGKAHTHTVVGNMTLNGITKQLTFPAIIDTSGDTVSASTRFVIDRNDFDITYKGKVDDFISPKVLMIIDLQAPKPS